MRGCTIANVDGFQGSEREVMVLSSVRCNCHGDIGLVKDGKRMNVALTRAKRGLIVVGNYHTLTSGDDEGLWTAWFRHVPIMNDAFRIVRADELEAVTWGPKVAQVPKKVPAHKAEDTIVPWQPYFMWRDVEPQAFAQDRGEYVRRMWGSVTRLMTCPLWCLLCAFVLALPKHKYTMAERPADFHSWDRKCWSHLHDFCALGVKLDPWNIILYFTLRAILVRTRVCKVVPPFDPHKQLACFTADVTEKDLLSMIAGERIAVTSDAGDVLQAVGGVCHPWRQEARALQREKLAEFSKTEFELDEFRRRLQEAVRQMKELVSYDHCMEGPEGWRATLSVIDGCSIAPVGTRLTAKRARSVSSMEDV